MNSGGPKDEGIASGIERGEDEWGGYSILIPPSSESGERHELPHDTVGTALIEYWFSAFWNHGTLLVEPNNYKQNWNLIITKANSRDVSDGYTQAH